MSIFRPGAYLEAPPGPRYLSTLHFAELGFPTSRPKPSTLARFRESIPDTFRLSLVVPDSVWQTREGPLRPGPELDSALAWVRAAVAALRPAFVLLATGARLTPGSKDRAWLRAYLEGIGAGTQVVWEPGGLWEIEDADRWASETGAICAFDPLMVEPPGGPICYARLSAIGGRRRFAEGLLLDALEVVLQSGADDIFVAIRSPNALREAIRMQELARELVE